MVLGRSSTSFLAIAGGAMLAAAARGVDGSTALSNGVGFDLLGKGGTPAQVKVMSFNLRTSNANDACPSGCWKLRKDRAKQMLSSYDPDFVGTQEGAPDQIDYMQKTLGYGSVGECAGECAANERNSIFFKKDRWTLLEEKTFALSDTPEKIPSNSWNLEYLRAAVMARFQDKTTGSIVCMLNTHYDITRGQDKSSVLVAQRLGQFCKPTDSVFMTGDLNTTPQSTAVQYLLGETTLSGSKTPIVLYDSVTAAGAGGGTWIGSSFGGKAGGAKMDYVFSRQDNQTCLQEGKLITDTFDGHSASDHAVLMSTFCLGQRQGCGECKNA